MGSEIRISKKQSSNGKDGSLKHDRKAKTISRTKK